MKTKLFTTAVSFFFITSSLQAQDYKTAAGIRFSNKDAAINHSLSLKYFFNPTTAVEGLVSFGNSFAVGVLVEKHTKIGASGLQWFYGAGAFAGAGQSRLGAQGVLGLDYKVVDLPLNVSLDWKPELSFVKEFSFEPAAIGLSARFTIQ